MLPFAKAGLGAIIPLALTQQLCHAQAPVLQVSPATEISLQVLADGKWNPPAFRYALRSSGGRIDFMISGIPTWLNASFTTGTATTESLTVTITLSDSAKTLAPGSYSGAIIFINATNGQGTQARNATLTVEAGR
jgi:hypothetical protein